MLPTFEVVLLDDVAVAELVGPPVLGRDEAGRGLHRPQQHCNMGGG